MDLLLDYFIGKPKPHFCHKQESYYELLAFYFLHINEHELTVVALLSFRKDGN